jgi:preprotein translocase subunit SecD
MADSKWPHIVSLISVIGASSTALYTTYSNNSVSVELEELKNNYAQETQTRKENFSAIQSRCNSISLAATNLAKARSEAYINHDLDQRSSIQASLWAAATLLSPDNKTLFLNRVNKGVSKDDTYEMGQELELITIALKGLALDSKDCYPE